ncbi:bifunctional DNA primase/polymerase [Streptomyces sp. NPDC059193]|uniref:bifunctional DNA primase/polymerase n=1 Tax=Streptomyces sp. NPDC059193 TaxID=3346763 RepID=UPI0036AD83C6
MISALPSRQTLKAAALAAAERGWRVFPLRPGSLTPAVPDWQRKATCDPERISNAWDHGPYNVAAVPCPSNLIILDLVPARPGERPPLRLRSAGIHDGADVLAELTESANARFPFEVFTVATPGGGMHLYFTHPPQGPCPQASTGTDSALGWHVAIRSAGTFVPLPGSVVADGAYEIAHDGLAGRWPAYLARHLSSGPTSKECAAGVLPAS